MREARKTVTSPTAWDKEVEECKLFLQIISVKIGFKHSHVIDQ